MGINFFKNKILTNNYIYIRNVIHNTIVQSVYKIFHISYQICIQVIYIYIFLYKFDKIICIY